MKLNQISRALALFFITCGFSFGFASCEDENKGSSDDNFAKGTIEGVVTDAQSNPLADVTVTLMKTNALRDVEATTRSAADGSFSFSNVPMTSRFLSFEKDGYATVGITVNAGSFSDTHARLAPMMEYANAVIKGKVLDAQNGNGPLSGAVISIGNGADITTGSDGTYSFEGLILKEYTLSISKLGYGSVTKDITVDMFVDGTCTIPDVVLGGKEILPGLTKTDLLDADSWYTNDYRGGKGNGGGWVDWSCVFMGTLTYVGNYEYQNEGCSLRTLNDGDQQKRPADLDNFESFTYGKKLITEDNSIMTLYVRTHNTSADDPFQFGVQVVDLNAADPVAVKVGDNRAHGSDSYSEYTFDLREYIGKEVILAVGVYRAKTGDYWHQLPIRHMTFAKEQVNNDNYIPGDEIADLPGWHMTLQNIRSIMPNEKTSFRGMPMGAQRDHPGYQVWNRTNHIAANWGFTYVNKDTEPLASEGFIIKTPSGVAANYDTPCSYFYSKFAISGANDHMTLRVRNFDGNTPTTFKVTAITDEGEVTHLAPVKNNAQSASAVAGGNGCWQYIHENGAGAAEDYAAFEYDLSAYSGKNVTIAIGVYKGVTDGQGGEQKLVIYGVDFD